jgi:translation initiation factor IF-2
MRLNKIAKDFNVGIQTLIEFLSKQTGGEDYNPMSNVSDEQYELLCREFSKDKSAKIESDRLRNERQSGREKQKEERKAPAAHSPLEEVRLSGPKVIGQIDLNAPRHTAPVQQKTVETKPAATVASQPEAPKTAPTQQPKPEVRTEVAEAKTVAQTTAPATTENKTAEPAHLPFGERSKSRMSEEPLPEAAKTNEVFRLNPTHGPQLNVVGTIDLEALNQSTRPRKKSKEEKRREREQKPGQNAAQGNAAGANRNGAENGTRKRQRINAQKVDINAVAASGRDAQNNNRRGQNGNNGGQNGNNNNNNNANKKNRLKKPLQKTEVSEEDVQKQVKETLARLMGKPEKKAVKYRKDKRNAAAERAAEMQEEEAAESKVLKLTEFVTANDLATMMNVSVTQVITTCMSIGIMVSINQRLDAETINLVAEEFGFSTEYVSNEVAQAIQEEDDKEEDLVTRPPIITVMGHVDHGKTKLLDYIRNTNVIAGEAGGITQHIGAYNVQLADGRRVTFLDTPGHEAFTAMRARGAKMTDIAIIIIADDGIMPQTKEAINHAAAANVPIVFAINKIDKPTANPNKVKEQLSAMNYLVEEWGGKYQSQDISAREGLNVDLLLEKVLLEAEMLELKANPNRRAVGSVIESTLDKGRGYVATVLVQNGTLHVGDVILAGTNFGRVKAMYNERNQKVQSAGPSTPVQVLGMNGAPQAGDQFNVLETEQEAREIATKRERLAREQSLRTQTMLTLDEIGRRIAVGNFQELNLIVKGDVDGSVEALSDSLIKLSTPQIQVNVIHKAVGQISESDVTLAAASKAIIVGFQVRPSQAARRMAEHDGVEIRLYSIIYDAIEEVKDAMEGMLAPETKEEIDGYLEVKTVFKITKVGTVAGCLVKEGKIKRTDKVRVIRDGIVLYAGELGSLKRFKDDVKEVATNFECGLNINGFNDLMEGDLVEAYSETLVKKKL